MKRKLLLFFTYGVLCIGVMSGCKKEETKVPNINFQQNIEVQTPIKTIQEDAYDELLMIDDLDEETEIVTNGRWEYCENSLGGITIKSNGIDVEAPLSEVTIPSEIDGKIVTKIGSYCFSECDFSKITIPDTIKVVDDFAFYNCIYLKELVIGDEVIKLGDGIAMNCEKLEKVTLPEGLNRIGNSAFCNAKNLYDIQIPSTVTKIGQFAFYNTAITNIVIPEGVFTIPEAAFASCKQLTSVTIPSSIALIEHNAFLECSELNLQIPKNPNMVVYDTSIIGVKSYNNDITLTTYMGYPDLEPDESSKISPVQSEVGKVLTNDEAQALLDELMQDENYETFDSETDDINFITAPKFD